MATRLGDASIRIQLDPGDAQQKLGELAQNIKRIDEARKETSKKAERDERSARDPRSKRATRSTPPARGALDTAMSLLVAAQTASMMGQTVLPQVSAGLREATAGTPFAALGERIDQVTSGLADRLTALETRVTEFAPAAKATADYAIASVHVTGQPPSDPLQLFREVYEIKTAQQQLTRDMDREVRRETIRLLFQGAKRTFVGGQ